MHTKGGRGEDANIIIQQFIRFAAKTGGLVGQAAASSGGLPPIVEFLARVTAGLRSGGFSLQNDKVPDVFYGGFRLYVSLLDGNGKAFARITKIAEVTARLVEVVETIENWARRGYTGLVEFTTTITIPNIVAGFTIAVFLTLWRDGDLRILLDIQAPSVRHLANLTTQSISG